MVYATTSAEDIAYEEALTVAREAEAKQEAAERMLKLDAIFRAVAPQLEEAITLLNEFDRSAYGMPEMWKAGESLPMVTDRLETVRNYFRWHLEKPKLSQKTY